MFIQNFLQTYKWLLIASFFSALTILMVKQYENSTNYLYLLVVALSELGLIYSYIELLQKGELVTQFALVKIISILIVILPSIMFFGSELTTKKIIGLMFGMIAIYLLN
jgi:multidrug transporter EmrE-like cation transporter